MTVWQTDEWREVVRLTDGLARVGYLTTRGDVSHNGRKWVVTCRRSREGYVPQKQSIWNWAD